MHLCSHKRVLEVRRLTAAFSPGGSGGEPISLCFSPSGGDLLSLALGPPPILESVSTAPSLLSYYCIPPIRTLKMTVGPPGSPLHIEGPNCITSPKTLLPSKVT